MPPARNSLSVLQQGKPLAKMAVTEHSHRSQVNVVPSRSTKLLPKLLQHQRTEADLNSQISCDEWGEVQKYGMILEQEMKEKERNDFLHKQRLVKQTLDQQVQEQRKLKLQKERENKELDKMIIDADRSHVEKENQKKALLQQKVMEAKQMRD